MSKLVGRLRKSKIFKCVRPQGESDSSKEKKVQQKPFSDVHPAQKAPAGAATEGKNNQSGLSVRQVFSLRQSWKAIMRVEEEFGVELHIRLFKTNAKLQSLFSEFKDISSDDELRTNEALEHHATLVMTTLDDAITHIDDYDFVRKILIRTGSSHNKFEGFQPEYFLNIKEPFLQAVKETLGDRYTENIENIYTIAITFILDLLVEGMNSTRPKDIPKPAPQPEPEPAKPEEPTKENDPKEDEAKQDDPPTPANDPPAITDVPPADAADEKVEEKEIQEEPLAAAPETDSKALPEDSNLSPLVENEASEDKETAPKALFE